MDHDKNELRILAEIQKAFTDWRLKNKRGTPIPDELWEKAFPLLSKYTVTKVAGALRLNGPELRRRATEAGFVFTERSPRKAASPKKKTKPRKTTFIEVLPTTDGQPAGEATNGWRLILTRGDGSRLEIIPPAFNDAQMQTLVHGFLGG